MPNPYTAPVESSAPDADTVRPVGEPFGEIARSTFLAWEKMRLIYIGLCAAPTLVLGATGATESIGSSHFWIPVIVGGIVANLFYFIGPIVETYVTWLGFRSKKLRWMLFAFGTLFTVMMAIGALIRMVSFPN
ncbi:MAG: hypothetical protein WBD20_15460 [Pirellulaceae bacterium]